MVSTKLIGQRIASDNKQRANKIKKCFNIVIASSNFNFVHAAMIIESRPKTQINTKHDTLKSLDTLQQKKETHTRRFDYFTR